MLARVNISQLTLAPKALYRRSFPITLINAVLDEDTGELMEYCRLMKNPKYRPLYRDSYTKEFGGLSQGMPGLAEGTNAIIFIPKQEVPAD